MSDDNNTMDIVRLLGSRMALKEVEIRYLCQGCHLSEVDMINDAGECLEEMFYRSLEENGWSPENGLCEECWKEQALSDQEAKMMEDEREIR